MIPKDFIDYINKDKDRLSSSAIVELMELHNKKEQTEQKKDEKKVLQPTDEEVKEAVNLMFTGLH